MLILILICILEAMLIIYLLYFRMSPRLRSIRYDVIAYDNYKIILYKGTVQKWLKVTDDQGDDVTERIIPYAGQYKNFYEIKTRISDIIRGKDKLNFIYDDQIRSFEKFIEF